MDQLHSMTLFDIVKRNSALFPDKIAWTEASHDKSVTFSQIEKKAMALAAGLTNLGVKKQDRIAILGKNSLEYFIVYLAASAIGAIVLPLNWRLSSDEIVLNINDCTPIAIFADSEYEKMLIANSKALTSIKNYICLEPCKSTFKDFDSLLITKDDFQPVAATPDDSLVIMHTAAVAGKPRGAIVSHGNIVSGSIHFIHNLNIGIHDIHMSILPLFHAAGLFITFSAFYAGAETVNMQSFDADEAAAIIEKKKVSYFFDFTPILSAIMDAASKSNCSLASLTRLAGIETPEIIEKYQSLTGGVFHVLYGQTETSAIATIGRHNDCPGSAGRPVLLSDVRLFNDQGHVVKSGDVGEIAVRGPIVFNGYWNLHAETRHTFRNNWHHTGDLGSFDENGFLFYNGRKPEKELIKPGGENVYPAEVENVIMEHPAVEMVVVFGVPDPKWKEGIKAVCKLKKGQTLTLEELSEFVASKIASFKKPGYAEFPDNFPVTDDGLPDREKIKNLFCNSQS